MSSKAEKKRTKKARARAQIAEQVRGVRVPVAAPTGRAQAEARSVAHGLRETARLEAARTGEKVERPGKEGPLRLSTRDGLASLHKTNSLNTAEVEAGLAYRLCMEHAGAGLRSALAQVEGGGGGRVHGGAVLARDKAALMRAYLMARLNQMERAVDAAALDGRELLALRLIAGEGRTLSSITTAGNAKLAYLAALRRALAAVASVMKVQVGLANRDG